MKRLTRGLTMPRHLLAVCLVTIALTGCAGEFNRQESGTVLGGIAGGLIGNQFGRGSGRVAATFAGAVIGGIIGNEIGRKLDERDRLLAQQAEYRALESGRSGEPVPWRNPDSGHYGEVVPREAYDHDRFGKCREFEHIVHIDGQREIMRGRACRNSNGTWRNVG